MIQKRALLISLMLVLAACTPPHGVPSATPAPTGEKTQNYQPLNPAVQTPPPILPSRIAESTHAFLRALPRSRNVPTAYDKTAAWVASPDAPPAQALARDDGRIRIGLLLPLGVEGAENEKIRTIAYDLLNAAQLAMFDIGRPEITLIVEDTKATPEGAAKAARKVIQHGAQLVIGPLFANSVEAVRPIMRRANVPTLAFSNNRAIAGRGVWLIGFLPEQNLTRILNEAHAQGFTRIAALIPQTDYGRRIETALGPIIKQLGGELVQVETYQDQAHAMFEPAQKIAQHETRKQAWAEERQRLTDEAALILSTLPTLPTLPNVPPDETPTITPAITEDTPPEEIWEMLGTLDPELKAEYEALGRVETFGALPYDAVLIPEGGIKLRSLAPLLPYFDVDPRQVKFLGTGLWDDPILGREPPLVGGWYAAPQPGGWQNFAKRYQTIYGHAPVRLASLAYDAMSLVAALSANHRTDPFARKNLTTANGFQGIDGIFRLTKDGLNERGLAVLEVRPKRNRLISPAPKNFVAIDRGNDRRGVKLSLPKAKKTKAKKPRPPAIETETETEIEIEADANSDLDLTQ